MKQALFVLAVALLLAGCGGDDGSGSETTTSAEPTTAVVVYFLRDEKVWPVAREASASTPEEAMSVLAGGPNEEEESALELTTAVEGEPEVSLDGDVASVSGADLSDEARAQIVYTLTSIPTVSSVEIDGEDVTRADFEEQTPPVLVEAPLAFEQVSSPLEATGTANTFEATFSFEVKDASGAVIASDFATATSGSGTRGTFDFTQPFVVDEDQEGSLVVFELSAEDGSRTNEIEIPLQLLG